MSNSTADPSGRKSAPKFPLWFHHGSGQWCKKIRGRHHYFGTDSDEALKKYLAEKDDLEAGRRPKPFQGESATLLYLCNHFLTHKKHQYELGEITGRTFADYEKTCELMLKHLGKTTAVEHIRPDDLLVLRRKLAKGRNATSLGNDVNRVRVVLRHAFENMLIERPVRFGDFKKPSKKVVRRERAKNGARLYSRRGIRLMLAVADVQLKAMILLGVQAGMGNADCGTLPLSAVDLDRGWIDFPRNKTGVARRFSLWPETVKALRAALASRKQPRDAQHADLVFVTKYGKPWHVDTARSAVSQQFTKLVKRLDAERAARAEARGRDKPAPIYRAGVGFYGLRHTFQTEGEECGDIVATRHIMGHSLNDISEFYRERVADERLLKVTNHVRAWLYGKGVSDA